MSYLVGNPDDRLSHVAAQLRVYFQNGPISNRPDIDASLREVLPLERRLDSK